MELDHYCRSFAMRLIVGLDEITYLSMDQQTPSCIHDDTGHIGVQSSWGIWRLWFLL